MKKFSIELLKVERRTHKKTVTVAAETEEAAMDLATTEEEDSEEGWEETTDWRSGSEGVTVTVDSINEEVDDVKT